MIEFCTWIGSFLYWDPHYSIVKYCVYLEKIISLEIFPDLGQCSICLIKHFFIMSWVDQEVEGAHKNLECNFHVFFRLSSFDHGFEHIIWELLSCLIVLGNLLNYRFVPHPVLKHLTWQLYEVSLHTCSRESGKVGFSAHVVHDVSKLMEKGSHVLVSK